MPVLEVLVYWLSYNIIQFREAAHMQSIFNESNNNNVCICNCKKGCRSNVCPCKTKSSNYSILLAVILVNHVLIE